MISRIDQYGRRHPRLMMLFTLLLGIVTTLVLIYHTQETAIVYRAF